MARRPSAMEGKYDFLVDWGKFEYEEEKKRKERERRKTMGYVNQNDFFDNADQKGAKSDGEDDDNYVATKQNAKEKKELDEKVTAKKTIGHKSDITKDKIDIESMKKKAQK